MQHDVTAKYMAAIYKSFDLLLVCGGMVTHSSVRNR